jgi:hypothetical protein
LLWIAGEWSVAWIDIESGNRGLIELPKGICARTIAVVEKSRRVWVGNTIGFAAARCS